MLRVSIRSAQKGEKLWHRPINTGLSTSPALDTNGTAYVMADDGYAYAIDNNNSLSWQHKIGGYSFSHPSPVMDSTGAVYMIGGQTVSLIFTGTHQGLLKSAWPMYRRDAALSGSQHPEDLETDTDGDGMSDRFEQRYGFDAHYFNDGSSDTDEDGYTDLQEFHARTDPLDVASIPADGTVVMRYYFDTGSGPGGWSNGLPSPQGQVEPMYEPALALDGSVYIGWNRRYAGEQNGAYFDAVDQNGHLLWRYEFKDDLSHVHNASGQAELSHAVVANDDSIHLGFKDYNPILRGRLYVHFKLRWISAMAIFPWSLE